MTRQRIRSCFSCLLAMVCFASLLCAQDFKKEEIRLIQMINQEKNLTTRNKCIDSLLYVFEQQEKTGTYQQKNDLLRATFMFRSAAPRHFKIDTLLYRAIYTYENTVGDAILLQYCANLNNCLLVASADKQPIYKTRMLQCVFNFTAWNEQQHYSEQTKKSIQLFQKQIIPVCADYTLAADIWLHTLPKLRSEKTKVLQFLKNEFEHNQCTQERTYNTVLDSLLALEPSAALWLNKSIFYAEKADYVNEYNSLNKAKSLCHDPEIQDSLHYLLVKNRFNAKEYLEVVGLSREQNTHFKQAILLLAFQSIIKQNERCSASEFEKKMNSFYAYQLLKEASQLGKVDEHLAAEITSRLPTNEELAQHELKLGDKYHLKCWDLNIILEL